MVTTIEKVPSGIPEGYKDLFETGTHLKEMRRKSVEEIILGVCREALGFQWGRKVSCFDTRALEQQEHAATSAAKVENYREKNSIWPEGVAVALSVGAAFAGGASGLGGLLSAGAQGCSTTSNSMSKFTAARTEGYNHRYQLVGTSLSERTQQMQAADRGRDQAEDAIRRITDAIHRTFELILQTPG